MPLKQQDWQKKKAKKSKPIISEHEIQVSFFKWLELQYPAIRKRTIKITNEGKRSFATAMWLKAEGLTKGAPDVFCAFSNGEKHGLWIEFKTGNNKLTEEQEKFAINTLADGYEFVLCRSLDEAISALQNYLTPKATNANA